MNTISWKERYKRSKSIIQRTIAEYNRKPELKAYLEILLTLTAVCLFGIFAIRPTLKTIGILIREINEKERVLETMNKKLDNLKKAEDLFIQNENKIKLVNEAIPTSPDPDKLLLQIEELVYKNHCEISSFSTENITILGSERKQSKTNSSTVSDKVNFILIVGGEYQNLISLTEDIENLRRPIKFSSMSISKNSNGENILSLNLSNLESPFKKTEDTLIK